MDHGSTPGAARERAQRAGVAALIALAGGTAVQNPRGGTRVRRHRHSLKHLRRGDRRPRGDGAVLLAARKATPGALSAFYAVPRVRYTGTRNPLIITVAAGVAAALAAHHFISGQETLILAPVWMTGFAMRVVPLAISWFDRPFTVTPRQRRALDRLRVVVAVPVYNEDPLLLDRCLWALANQSRPPDVIHVVEDGPSADYTALRRHWERQPGVRWTQAAVNQGKKGAQSVVFTSHPEADIFVTVDSDTSLECTALAEGLKPFADPRNMSVAGVEENFNKRVNWLTRSVAVRNTYYQLTVWGAQSVLGDLLVNRGTFALYRAWVIREIVPAYVGETFLGRRIKLGDDAALTLFSRAHGRTVQQLSAFSLPMHPENLSHHFRQWVRWARGAVIRNCWRLRYLPVASYGFWWTMAVWYMVFMSAAMPVVLALTWPRSAHVLEFAGAAVICWTYTVGARTLSVRRSDDSAWSQARSLLLYPAGILWATLVLRPVRLYGVATFLKQRWTTRQAGTEDMALPEMAPGPVPVTQFQLEGAAP